MRLTSSGKWPDEVVLRSGWSKGIAREWNADLPYAHLRVIRGTSGFVREASDHLLGLNNELVASPPLGAGSEGQWTRAGYQPFLELHLYRRSLIGYIPEPKQRIHEIQPDFESLHAIDHPSFDPLWRMEPTGLHESYAATARATVLTTETAMAGYAIVGVAGVTGYLQRIAVHPDHRRQGHGRDLLRGALAWAAANGAASMLLNTQPENETSAILYRSEEFARVPGNLRVLRYDG